MGDDGRRELEVVLNASFAAIRVDQRRMNALAALVHKSSPSRRSGATIAVLAVLRLGAGVSSGKYFIGGLTIPQQYGQQRRCIAAEQRPLSQGEGPWPVYCLYVSWSGRTPAQALAIRRRNSTGSSGRGLA
jgi:hypothetical protein